MEDSDNFGKNKRNQIKVTLWSDILGIRKSLPVVLGLGNTYGRDNEVIRHQPPNHCLAARRPEWKSRFLTPVDRNNSVSLTVFPSQFSLDV